MKLTSIYASLLAILFVYLSFQTIKVRGRLKIAVGDGGNSEMIRAMRVHANFAEYVPFAVLMIALVELQGGNALLIHGLGILLVCARASHAYGVSQINENFRFRIFGMISTFITLIVTAGYLLASHI